jgi:hypothetical protein
MAHFAKVENGIVTDVIVATQDYIDTLQEKDKWIKTSYNTRAGVYYETNSDTPAKDQSKCLRKNFAGIDYSYDKNRDAFIPPKPFDSWLLDEETCNWVPPKELPKDGRYYWDETKLEWVRAGDK